MKNNQTTMIYPLLIILVLLAAILTVTFSLKVSSFLWGVFIPLLDVFFLRIHTKSLFRSMNHSTITALGLFSAARWLIIVVFLFFIFKFLDFDIFFFVIGFLSFVISFMIFYSLAYLFLHKTK